ncbi:hypothetical protein [Labilithrix luteola]|uniref:hypothetical protein n=1 Tax=Labilithrix luteola TaxID=1391654 RepID=UPI0011BA8F23|nr:hypothetical protein [Labilithrix luteola]
MGRFLMQAGLAAATLLLACGGETTSHPTESGSDASAHTGDSGQPPASCDIIDRDGGVFFSCPADGKTMCPALDGCNTCKCAFNSDFNRPGLACTTRPCPVQK